MASPLRFFVLDNGFVSRSLAQKISQKNASLETNRYSLTTATSQELSDLSTLVKTIASKADVLILDLNDPDFEKITAILAQLKQTPLISPLTLVGLSSVLTWNQTTRNSKKVLKESSFKARKCSPRYKNVRLLETLVLSSQKDNLTTVVVAPGILYGNGEETLHELFKSAWLCNPQGLPVYGDGRNVLPLLHVNDLCESLLAIGRKGSDLRSSSSSDDKDGSDNESSSSSSTESKQYIVLTDRATVTQKQLISTISNKLGVGKVYLASPFVSPQQQQDEEQAALIELLITDMKFSNEWLEQEQEDGHGNDDEIDSLQLTYYESSFVSNFEPSSSSSSSSTTSIKQQYLNVRNLHPIRLWLSGPPASGKTLIASSLAKQYYLPLLNVKDMIEEALKRGDEMSEKIKKAFEDVAALQALQGKSPSPALANKGKKEAVKSSRSSSGNGKKGSSGNANLTALLESSPFPRLPLPLLIKIIKRKLKQPECKNQGWILDGFPRTKEEAQLLFSPGHDWKNKKSNKEESKEDEEEGSDVEKDEDDAEKDEDDREDEKKEDGDDEEEATAKPVRDFYTTPLFVVSLSCSEQTAEKRTRELDEHLVIKGHNDEEGFRRRWAKWQAIHDPLAEVSLDPLPVLSEVEALELSEEKTMDLKTGLSLISMYLEKQGKPFNYHPNKEEIEQERNKKEQESKLQQEQDELKRQQQEVKEAEVREQQLIENARRRAQVLVEENEALEAASLPLRKYLLDALIPALVDGLLDVCQVKPEDPIDYLAEYLFKRSSGLSMDTVLEDRQRNAEFE